MQQITYQIVEPNDCLIIGGGTSTLPFPKYNKGLIGDHTIDIYDSNEKLNTRDYRFVCKISSKGNYPICLFTMKHFGNLHQGGLMGHYNVYQNDNNGHIIFEQYEDEVDEPEAPKTTPSPNLSVIPNPLPVTSQVKVIPNEPPKKKKYDLSRMPTDILMGALDDSSKKEYHEDIVNEITHRLKELDNLKQQSQIS